MGHAFTIMQEEVDKNRWVPVVLAAFEQPVRKEGFYLGDEEINDAMALIRFAAAG